MNTKKMEFKHNIIQLKWNKYDIIQLYWIIFKRGEVEVKEKQNLKEDKRTEENYKKAITNMLNTIHNTHQLKMIYKFVLDYYLNH